MRSKCLEKEPTVSAPSPKPFQCFDLVVALPISFMFTLFRSARTSWITFVSPSVRPSVRKKNLDQLYSSINHHRTTANLSDIVWCMSGGVWWCLVVSDACLVVSGGVNVYRLI